MAACQFADNELFAGAHRHGGKSRIGGVSDGNGLVVGGQVCSHA